MRYSNIETPNVNYLQFLIRKKQLVKIIIRTDSSQDCMFGIFTHYFNSQISTTKKKTLRCFVGKDNQSVDKIRSILVDDITQITKLNKAQIIIWKLDNNI